MLIQRGDTLSGGKFTGFKARDKKRKGRTTPGNALNLYFSVVSDGNRSGDTEAKSRSLTVLLAGLGCPMKSVKDFLGFLRGETGA